MCFVLSLSHVKLISSRKFSFFPKTSSVQLRDEPNLRLRYKGVQNTMHNMTTIYIVLYVSFNQKAFFFNKASRYGPIQNVPSLNLLKPTGYVMHQQFNIQQFYVLPTLYLCVLYLSENKQRLVPLTA